MQNLHFLAGLPRSGSTLLSYILLQNPNIHTEGTSALCQLMWDNYNSLYGECYQPIMATRKQNFINDFMSKIPLMYYKNIDKTIIDKNRAWVLPNNYAMIENYVNFDFKVIVTLRPLDEVVKSFLYLNNFNNNINIVDILKNENSEIVKPLYGIDYIKKQNDERFFMLFYDDLVNDTNNKIKEIYDFMGWQEFDHDFDNIKDYKLEDDAFLGINNLHAVRPKVEKQKYDIELSEEIMTLIDDLEKRYDLSWLR